MVRAARAGQPVGHGQLPDQIDAEQIDHHLEDGEHPGLDHGHRVQQGGYRGRRDHGRRQPAMEGHHRGLAGAEHIEHQQHAENGRIDVCTEHAAGRKRQGAGQLPGPDHGQQQEAYRGAHQQTRGRHARRGARRRHRHG